MSKGAIKQLMFALEQSSMPSSRSFVHRMMKSKKLIIKTFNGRYYLTDGEIDRIVDSLFSKGSYNYKEDNK